jgi:hypothetical protein
LGGGVCARASEGRAPATIRRQPSFMSDMYEPPVEPADEFMKSIR